MSTGLVTLKGASLVGVLQTQGSRIKGWLTATDCQLYGCRSVAKSYQSLRLYATPWTIACQTPLSFTVFQSLLKFMSIELVRLSNHLILCHLLFLLPSIFPRIRVFSSESALYIKWPEDWSFSLSISPSNEYSGLISFGIDCFHLAVQWTQESSPPVHFKSINSLVLNLCYVPTLTSIPNYWKSHSFD